MKELGEVTFMKEEMKALLARCGRFGAKRSSLARFVPEIWPFEKKRAGITNSVYSKSWILLTAHFGPVFIVPSQWIVSAVN